MTPEWRDLQDEISLGSYVRQAEIASWLRQARRSWVDWVAIDDQPHLFRPFTPNLVLTDPQTGLTDELCAILKKRLASP